MKKLLGASALVIAVALSATADNHDDEVSTQTRDVSSFDSVRLKGSMDVEIVAGKEQSVTVIADTKIIDDLLTEVDDDMLMIELDDDNRKRYRNIKKMLVKITVPSLKSGSVHGSGDMEIDDVEGDDLKVSVHGSGDLVVKSAKVEMLDASVHGSGDLSLRGSCEDVELSVHGSGDIEADDMECSSAEVSVHGSGDISVYASKGADVSIMGSGDVVLHGEPDKVSSKVRGSGDVHIRD